MTRMILMASVAVLALSSPIAANEIGSVAALNSDVDGTPPTSATRRLSIGEQVVQDEFIESSAIGSGQFLFLDQTTLTIAKNSKLVLDKYVYNPDTRTGEIAINMSQGVLRFIGGRITKNTDAVIVTPTATIGIRGGMAIITVDPDGTTRAQHVAGEYTRITTTNGEELVISRNNGLAEIVGGLSFGIGDQGVAAGGADGTSGTEQQQSAQGDGAGRGAKITYLGVADREYVSQVTRDLIGRGEAGERRKPQDPDVIASGIAVRNFQAKDVVSQPPISTKGEDADNDDSTDEVFLIRNEEEVQTTNGINVLPPVIPPVTRVPLDGVTGSAALENTGVPGLTTGGGPVFIFTQVFEGSRIGVTAAGEEFSVPAETTGVFSFDFSGGTSPRGAIAGNGFFNRNAEFLYAAIRTRNGATGYFLTGTPSGPLNDAPNGFVRTRAYALADDLFTGGAVFLPSAFSDRLPSSGADLLLISNESGAAAGGAAKALYGFLQIDGTGPGQTSGLGVFTANAAEAGSGTPEFASFFQGVFTDGVGGSSFVTSAVATVDDGQGGSTFGPRGRYFALSNAGDFGNGDETLVSSAVTEAGASTLFGSATYATRSGVVDSAALSRNPLGGTLNGYAAISASGQGGYSARNLSAADVAITLSPSGNSLTASLKLDAILGEDQITLTDLTASFGGANGESAFLNDQTFGARGAASGGAINGVAATTSGAFVTAGLVGDGGVFPEGTNTTPQHLTWGWWAASLDGSSGAVTDQDLHLGAWIAGDVTGSANLPLTGTATYDGFAAVSGVENGQSFVDGAKFQLTYEFGNGGLGTVQFNDLLGDDPTIAVTGVGSNGDYGGIAGITANGRPGLIAVDGRFFNANGQAAGATAGAIDVLSNDRVLRASGVFGGDRGTTGR